MNILKFITAGSVDDGKSTLIGRLLFDSKSILADQLEVLEKQSKNKNDNGIDLALLTDGLRAEREQGITIDIAYRYFSTSKRKFIIADAPGHVQYTRNMITGLSNSELMVILIDARIGVVEQTKRHSILASLLNLKNVIVVINKMDMVDYSEDVFLKIKEQYQEIINELKLKNIVYIPVSALKGENIVNRSELMPWYHGETLLNVLETIEVQQNADFNSSRFQVQCVIRPQLDQLHDYRGYAGTVISGNYKQGDHIIILPSMLETNITKIEIAGNEVEEAYPTQPVIFHIEHDIDVSRGDYFVKPDNLPVIENEVELLLCWLDETPLKIGNKYMLQQNSSVVKIIIKDINYKIDVNSFNKDFGDKTVKQNEVVKVTIKSMNPIVFDPFDVNNYMGRAILIDETSHNTVGACLLIEGASKKVSPLI
ncbi:GTP-binding protein [Chryseobacterium sp. G0240]|uniref:sulfate adenylyltransferase subunit 1 n=1 Tax=Chryseobacterium sp. G0240 TaxID=2487066 RepID=UPI000F4595C0|nr:GTP-binding protein [Chryseobacterium sp. G0240]ROI03189.1 GTP-binding protein [Chryseobacterium sp. G0240]